MKRTGEGNRPLSGVRVMVTRPSGQAAGFCQLVENAGGEAIHFSTLEIVPLQATPSSNAHITQLNDYDLAIFVSSNAARFGARAIAALHGRQSAHLRIACIGAATANELHKFGIHCDIMPQTSASSEALLAHSELRDLSAKRVLIFRGKGGRAVLGDTLRAQGASVDYVELYQRTRPPVGPQVFKDICRISCPHIICVTSEESLRNLVAMQDQEGRDMLVQCQLLLGSPRLAPAAGALGFPLRPLQAADPSDDTMFAVLLKWARQRRPNS